MIKSFLRFLLVLTSLFLALGGFSQVNDAQLWTSINLEKKLTPNLSIGFTQELRLQENMTEAGTIFSDLGVSYRFSKRFKAGASYRFSLNRRLDDTYEKRHSWYAEGFYREKFNPVTLVFRLRYQARYDEVFTSENAQIPQNHLRTKLTLKYDLKKKIEPYLSGEAFFRFGVPVSQSFDQLRLCAGVEYSFNRMHMIDLHYMISREFSVKNPETDYIIGVEYFFTF